MRVPSAWKQSAAVLMLAGLVVLGGCEAQPTAPQGAKPSLLLSLDDKYNTPDGMTLDPKTGDIILSCPNFNDTKYPGVLVKIDPQNTLTHYFDMPLHPETGKAGPMGLDFGPDGNLYVADNQYFNDKDHKSRLIRVNIKDSKPVGADVVVDGLKLSNAVIWKGNHVYVSDTFFDLEDKPGASGIYCISLEEMNAGCVKLKAPPTDPHLIAQFQTTPLEHRHKELAGADGLTFDSKGNLYTGNFGDGAFSKIAFDADGKVTSNTIIHNGQPMTCVDGIFCDLANDEIYVADSEKNAIHIVSPDGKVRTLWQNDDCDGSDGRLDQPCEVLIRGKELIIVNFDWPFPGLKNSEFDKHHTLSVIRLDK